MGSNDGTQEDDQSTSSSQESEVESKKATKKGRILRTMKEHNANGKVLASFRLFSRQTARWVKAKRRKTKNPAWLPPLLDENQYTWFCEASLVEPRGSNEPDWPPHWDEADNNGFRTSLTRHHGDSLRRLLRLGLRRDLDGPMDVSSAGASSEQTVAAGSASGKSKGKHCNVQEARQSNAGEALKTKKRQEEAAMAAKREREEEAARQKEEAARLKEEEARRDAEAAEALRKKKKKEEEEKAAREKAEASRRETEAAEVRRRKAKEEEDKAALQKAEAARQQAEAASREAEAEASKRETEAEATPQRQEVARLEEEAAEALRKRQQDESEERHRREEREAQERVRARELAEARAGKVPAIDSPTESSEKSRELTRDDLDGGRHLSSTSRPAFGALFNIASSVFKAATAPGKPATSQSDNVALTIPEKPETIPQAIQKPKEQRQAPVEDTTINPSHNVGQSDSDGYAQSESVQRQTVDTAGSSLRHGTQARRTSMDADQMSSITLPGEQLFLSAIRTALSRDDWEPGMGGL